MQKALDILKEYWGYDSFRGIQADIVNSVLEGHDTLGLMPTGGGKSITFQVPTMCMEGLCLVVTPLIALMKDQVHNLRVRSRIPAEAVYSGMTATEMDKAFDNCVHGKTKFLYVSPERLETEYFKRQLKRLKICLIAVDEAHCISQWGYDFRPAYLRVRDIRQLLPGIPVLALTATATPEVVQDICQKLDFPNTEHVFRMSFERKNLCYVVRKCQDKEKALVHILQSVAGTAIIYTRSREGTRDVAMHLEECGISATNYHAGLSPLDKEMRQDRWQKGEKRVMVATNAFGMGIDKADVRLVIHLDLPDSVEAYFQEAGRAGRDGQKAWCVLLVDSSDMSRMRRRVNNEFPPKEACLQLYERLAYFLQIPMGEGFGRSYEFNMGAFCHNFHYYPNTAEAALNILTRAGYINYQEESENVSRVMMIIRRDDLYYMHHFTAMEERIIAQLLRKCPGIFSEYAFLREEDLATEMGVPQDTIYNLLVGLTRQRVLNYVPRKNVPRIVYEMSRQPIERIHIGRDIYEDRREVYERRIEAICQYASDMETCHSQYLLRYFGQKDAKPCGQCDVCLAAKK